MSGKPRQPCSVTPFLALPRWWWDLCPQAAQWHHQWCKKCTSLHFSTNENTASGSSSNFLPSPFLSQREKHSPIKLKENKVIKAKLLININSAAVTGASHWAGTPAPKMYKPLRPGCPCPLSHCLGTQELTLLLTLLHSHQQLLHPPLGQTSLDSGLFLPATLPPRLSLVPATLCLCDIMYTFLGLKQNIILPPQSIPFLFITFLLRPLAWLSVWPVWVGPACKKALFTPNSYTPDLLFGKLVFVLS